MISAANNERCRCPHDVDDDVATRAARRSE
jgi:hypothetical protein